MNVLTRFELSLTQPPTESIRQPTTQSIRSIPVITAEELVQADGLLFGFPTRFGAPAAQMKAFWDSTGGLWAKGALVGKPVGFFYGTGTQNGGQV
jgi:NAD(P)H dehydrogenase (quinone)